MSTSYTTLYCPSCGDGAFYSSRPLDVDPDSATWVVLSDGAVALARTADDGELTILTRVQAEVYCQLCHSAVTSSSVLRVGIPLPG